MDQDERIAIVGAGLVGSGWSIVFARAGLPVRVFDASEPTREAFMATTEDSLAAMHRHGLIEDPQVIAARITVVPTLEEALDGATYVQESIVEQLEPKVVLAKAIGALLPDGAVVGSSTSGFPASAFTEQAPRRERFLVAHPVNPPHLVPVVEIVPAPWTDQDAVERTAALMAQVGQAPVRLRREIDGFILNRLQGALLDEAWRLYEEGYAGIADIDATVSQGLGLRWSFIGPFETIDLNAPGGIDDYAARLAPMYHRLAEQRGAPRPWSAEAVERAAGECRAARPAETLAARRAWRDERLMELAARRRQAETG